MTSLASDRARTTRPAGVRDVLRVRVPLWVAVVFMAFAFGAGMAIRVVSQPEPAPLTATSVSGGSFPFAPPLTDQQIQEGLPSGHPDLSNDGAATKGDNGSKGSPAAKDQNTDPSGAEAGTP